MGYEAHCAKEFLLSVRWAHLEEQRIEDRIQTLTDRAHSITSSLKDVCVRGGGGSIQKDDFLVGIADEVERLLEAKKDTTQRILDVESFIDRLHDPRHRRILHLRYVQGLRWERIAEAMTSGHIYYSERQIYRLHKYALRAADRLWAQEQQSGEDDYVDS